MRYILRIAIPALMAASLAPAQTFNISGTVTDSAGAPVAGAAVKLEHYGAVATSGADGRFTLASTVGIAPFHPLAPRARLHRGNLALELPSRSRVSVTAFGPDGAVLGRSQRDLDAGSHSLALPGSGSGLRFFAVAANGLTTVVRGLALEGSLHSAAGSATAARAALSKGAAGELYDVIIATKIGYIKSYAGIAKAETSGVVVKLLKETAPKFSFFVASMRGMQKLANNDKGFGGDLRFGETGAGAGLRGADKICATLAEASMPGSSFKGWRAFLSVTADAYGQQVNAIDRIGAGPWYDRLGRLLAPTLNDLKNTRPQNGDPSIQNDFPNEDGVLNHHPGPGGEEEDNHHMLTGSSASGALKSGTATCKDWTIADGSSANGKPSCGFAWPRGAGGGGTSGSAWMSGYDAPGCAAGIDIAIAAGPKPGDVSVGGGGGYGGIICFALNP